MSNVIEKLARKRAPDSLQFTLSKIPTSTSADDKYVLRFSFNVDSEEADEIDTALSGLSERAEVTREELQVRPLSFTSAYGRTTRTSHALNLAVVSLLPFFDC